jgi:Glycosyltransferase like family
MAKDTVVDWSAVSIDVIAAVNDNSVLAANLGRSPMLQRPNTLLYVQRGYRSAAQAYRTAMQSSRGDFLVFAHQDVYLPSGWDERLLRSIAYLDEADPQWAVLGVFGVTRQGAKVGRVWSSGLNTMLGDEFERPVAVESIDEVLIVLRRASGIEFDESLPGFHLYGTDLVQSARTKGMGCYAIYAPLIHNSRPCRYLGGDYFASYRFVARKWHHRLPIANNVASIVGPGFEYGRLRARHLVNSLRYWRQGRRSETRVRDCVMLARQLELE